MTARARRREARQGAAVARGIAFLDERWPVWREDGRQAAWADQIDVDVLDVSDAAVCPMGQLCPGKFFWGAAALEAKGDPYDWAIAHGFAMRQHVLGTLLSILSDILPEAPSDWIDDHLLGPLETWYYRHLTERWRDAIVARRRRRLILGRAA